MSRLKNTFPAKLLIWPCLKSDTLKIADSNILQCLSVELETWPFHWHKAASLFAPPWASKHSTHLILPAPAALCSHSVESVSTVLHSPGQFQSWFGPMTNNIRIIMARPPHKHTHYYENTEKSFNSSTDTPESSVNRGRKSQRSPATCGHHNWVGRKIACHSLSLLPPPKTLQQAVIYGTEVQKDVFNDWICVGNLASS